MALAVASAAVSAASPALADTDCIIREFRTAKGVYQREPVEPTTEFVVEYDRVHAFLRLDCSRADPDRPAFTLRWIASGRVVRTRDLYAGVSPNWRTWDLMPAIVGPGFVQLFDRDGTLLAEEAFTVRLP
ncbi:hypothetical protein EDC65_3300 [Stella humosa]|uniref:Uncharacterized protein n=1 Tax=Stella humosa TaxID=94 RepID=A0A3N1L0H1_9PROT|nr:hypothetical protein [Stella humosa]ROP83956.1 hypothetical protein EDC65_3300 [Stella humosa]BBK33464.1 hypothetical protein STHU_40980 [Stella humosa]